MTLVINEQRNVKIMQKSQFFKYAQLTLDIYFLKESPENAGSVNNPALM